MPCKAVNYLGSNLVMVPIKCSRHPQNSKEKATCQFVCPSVLPSFFFFFFSFFLFLRLCIGRFIGTFNFRKIIEYVVNAFVSYCFSFKLLVYMSSPHATPEPLIPRLIHLLNTPGFKANFILPLNVICPRRLTLDSSFSLPLNSQVSEILPSLRNLYCTQQFNPLQLA